MTTPTPCSQPPEPPPLTPSPGNQPPHATPALTSGLSTQATDATPASSAGTRDQVPDTSSASSPHRLAPHPSTTVRRLVRFKPRSTAVLILVSVVGVLAFGWPLVWQTGQVGESAIGHTTDAPWLFVLLLPLLVAVVVAELAEDGIDAKVISLLGMLAAVGAALRALGPGTAGLEPGFFVLILAARAFGAGFGFVLGAISLLAGALISGGVGPWMPFQMLACGWVGCLAGLLPRLGPSGRLTARLEILLLAGYALVAGVVYGVVMNLWFWPYATFGSDFSFVAGAPLDENLHRYFLFVVATSLGWDIPRGVLSAVLVLLLGRPILTAFRRTARKAAFTAPVAFER